MKILIITPAPRGSRKGNRRSAVRYARLLRELGHTVRVSAGWEDQAADLLIALHARKSARAVKRFHRKHPRRPIIVVLTGTDLYQDLPESRTARESLSLAKRLVVLQPKGLLAVPKFARIKTHPIIQSARPAMHRAVPSTRHFQIAQLAHIRPVKDPWRPARAARLLPSSSQAQIVHAGDAPTPGLRRRAIAESAANPRYRWVGDLAPSKAKMLLARSRVLVLSSRLEGGANVLSEALAAGIPIVCSRIPGSVGILGEDYPGYYPVGNEVALARLLRRAEADPDYYRALKSHCRDLKPLVHPDRERRLWGEVIRSAMG